MCIAATLVAVHQTAIAMPQLTCSYDGTVHLRDSVTINEPGQPGLVWVGMHNPAKTAAYLLDLQGNWQAYNGGLLPPAGRYDGGLPTTMTLDVTLPAGSTLGSSDAFVGWQVYEGYGVYTPKSRQMVAERRSALNEIKPTRVAAGKWNAEYDSDDRFIWSLVQKDMTDNSKYVNVMTIPYVNCYASSGGNH